MSDSAAQTTQQQSTSSPHPTPPTITTQDQPPATTSTTATPNPLDTLLITASPLESYNSQHLVASPAAGAISVFVGITRNNFEGRSVLHLSYECYEAMAVKQLQQLACDMRAMWTLQRVAIIHRTGAVAIGEASVLIAASSAHRREALDAVSWCIDELKRKVTIWKREVYEDGSVWKENSEFDVPALIKQTTDVISPSHIESGQ